VGGPGEKGRKVYGRREKRLGGKRDSEGGGKQEKYGKLTQHCAMFSNRIKGQAGRENVGREPGLKGTGSGKIKPLILT